MTDSGHVSGRAGVLAACAKQIGWCETLGSPFTAAVLRILVRDIEGGGTAATWVDDWPGDPWADALPLRLTGALHALVLTGAAPDLASVYPPRDGGAADRLGEILPQVLDAHGEAIRAFLASPPQTNEVGRSAVLAGGFLEVARATGLPLRTFEIGASAGLNTVWDRYRYRFGNAVWGDPSSPLHLAPEWTGPPPTVATPLRVVARAACDLAPINLEDATQRLRLAAYVWPDQRERLARLEAAIAVARAAGHRVERADAAPWVADALRRPAPGCATVLYHSIMWQYLPAATQDAIAAAVDRAAAVASDDAPLAWLRFEPPGREAKPELRLTSWPGGREQRLAVAHAHGSTVEWLGA